MKRITVFLVISIVFLNLAFGKQIDVMTAKTVGQNFIAKRIGSTSLKNASDLELVFTVQSKGELSPGYNSDAACFYVFNINSSRGFIIVSAEDNVVPVLAYSDEVGFNAGKIPPDVAWWLNGYKEQIEEVRAKNMLATDEIKSHWDALTSGTGNYFTYKSVKTVNPLEQTTWDQSPNYNDLCPYDNTANDRTVTGCVATAMAQVMRFWNAPANGAGFHSYNDPKYGTQSANFGSTTYDWTNMPLSISSANTAIATLMYHCGVSVEMTYGVGATGGSSAYVISSASPVQACAEYALKTYFGYSTVVGKDRTNFPNKGDWQALLKTELDAGRPVIYAGFGSGGGHCFNCDGYDANDMFHFNWGWSGQFDGYFDVDALNPEGTGTGGGTGGFNSGQQCITGMQGPNGGGGGGGGGQSSTLNLYDYVTPSPADIDYGQGFTVHTDIVNNTTTDFTGDYCAAIFDNNNAFVDYVEVYTGQTLQAGYHYTNGLTFTSSGLLTMLPGSYSIGIFYSPVGDTMWIQVSDTLNYTNLAPMTVHHANMLELYATMAITPPTLVKDQSASVHLDIVNTGTATFNGTYDVSLYDLDGYAVATIGQLTAQSLPAGYHYTNGLDFSTTSLTCDPGTYLLAMQYLPDGTGQTWELTGSTNYLNPVEVTVQQVPTGSDPWEPNNTVAQASNLTATFTGNVATINTIDANISSSSSTADYDYYKLDLPAGFSYMVGARLNDLKNSGNGQTYSVDAIFSYSTDGGANWSATFDDVMANSIAMANGGTIYFLVSPKFTGKSGTYLLALTVNKNALGVDQLSADAIKIYPNPVKDFLMVDLSAFNGNFNQIEILNTQGQQVFTLNPKSGGSSSFRIPVDNLTGGLYFLQLQTDNGVYSKKFIINK